LTHVARHRRLLGDAIRVRRKQAGLSQEKLAEKSDLHPVYISALERGVKTISVDKLIGIAKALRCPVADFLRDIK
jgi:transcriptional regulator with XRE-family HTH domain